ncbi:MAG TPA: SdrD B-like domain-containing protein, partial [Burkholderiales bacterium]|nr:SdrD B-like domain-containing protein [Burkholderiales bacterium]
LITLSLGGSTTGTTMGTAVTAPDGSYSFSGLAAGTYTVAPSLTGYTFTPASNAPSLSSSTPTATVNFTEALAQ